MSDPPKVTKTDIPEETRSTTTDESTIIIQTGEKPWYQSVGVWGGLISMFSPLLAAITSHTLESADVGQLAISFAGFGAALGGLMAVVGRVRARALIIPKVLPK